MNFREQRYIKPEAESSTICGIQYSWWDFRLSPILDTLVKYVLAYNQVVEGSSVAIADLRSVYSVTCVCIMFLPLGSQIAKTARTIIYHVTVYLISFDLITSYPRSALLNKHPHHLLTFHALTFSDNNSLPPAPQVQNN